MVGECTVMWSQKPLVSHRLAMYTKYHAKHYMLVSTVFNVCFFVLFSKLPAFMFRLKKIPKRFVIHINIGTHFYYGKKMTVKLFVAAMMASILMFCMLFVLPPMVRTCLQLFKPLCIFEALRMGAKVLNRLIDRISVNGKHKRRSLYSRWHDTTSESIC